MEGGQSFGAPLDPEIYFPAGALRGLSGLAGGCVNVYTGGIKTEDDQKDKLFPSFFHHVVCHQTMEVCGVGARFKAEGNSNSVLT
jgi:hypothetical protein